MITYTKGYKYQLEFTYEVQTPVIGCIVSNRDFKLNPNGKLTIYPGYAWDGASGPTFDSASSMPPSLVHDVFCYCMRNKWISYETWQDIVNDFFYQQCVEAGMWKWRAKLWHAAVEFADAGNPNQGPDRIPYTAP